MAKFVVVINEVSVSGFEKIMSIVSTSGGQVKFIPQAVSQSGINTQYSMTGPDDKGLYHYLRIEFDDKGLDKAVDVLKSFQASSAGAKA
jgi:hypothetical protein